MPSGEFSKYEDLTASIRFDVQTTNSLVTPVVALVDIETTGVSARAATEDAIRQVELPRQATMRTAERMRFGWQGGHWVVLDGGTTDVSGFIGGAWSKTDRFPLNGQRLLEASVTSLTARCARIIVGRLERPRVECDSQALAELPYDPGRGRCIDDERTQ